MDVEEDALAPDEVIDFASLPGDVLTMTLAWLPPYMVCRLGLTAKALRTVAHADSLWTALLHARFYDCDDVVTGFPIVTLIKDAKCRAYGRLLHPRQNGFSSTTYCPNNRCGGALLREDGRRCMCVAARYRLPLVFGSLHPRRSLNSCLASGGFTDLIDSLHQAFDIRPSIWYPRSGASLDVLDEDSLAPLDLLFLCTTEGPPLADAELAALRSWVERGGALIVSAFANWSACTDITIEPLSTHMTTHDHSRPLMTTHAPRSNH